jgi:N-acetylglucosamine-6-phosphate deacetylase
MRVKRITLAPEIPGGLDLVRRMCSRGVVVSMGHTAATYDQASDAQLVGVSTLTHTFNAMASIHHRHPGALGYALEDSDISCELIYDRLHVHPAVAKILLKTKSKERVIAVSDSTAATGLPDGTKINMWGHPCHVSEGAVRLDSNDTLAGSTITLLDAFRNLAEDFGAIAAIRTCCMNPRTSMGLTGPPRVWNRFSSSFELLETVRIEP